MTLNVDVILKTLKAGKPVLRRLGGNRLDPGAEADHALYVHPGQRQTPGLL